MRGVVLLLVVFACSKSNPSRPDASPTLDPDAMPEPDTASLDAASPDAPPPAAVIQARITVEVNGQPRAGERILINRDEGSLVGEGMTDVTGAFNTMMPDGGSLTWVRLDLPLRQYYTYAGLRDGDVVNTGTPPPPTGTVTPISITRTQIPNAQTTKFGVDRFPDQTFTGTTFAYPTMATGSVTVIQDGRDTFDTSVGYSKTTVTVAPGAAVTMPGTIHQALDLTVDVVAPVLDGGLITATVVPFHSVGASQSRQEAADTSGAVSITFPRFVYSQVAYASSLSLYFETPGFPHPDHHFTHYTINSSITHASLGVADLAQCPRAVAYNGAKVTIGQPPSTGDFARYGLGRWTVTTPFTTTSIARIVVPSDLAPEFAGIQGPLMATTVDSGDVDYREALSLQRSTHYSQDAYTGDGHPYMRECWWFPPQ